VRERPEHAGNERPRRAEHGRRNAHRDDEERRRVDAVVAELEGDPGRANCAEVELSLGADVEKFHPERRCGREPREEDRRRRDERRRQRLVPGEPRLDDVAEGLADGVAAHGEDDGQDRERNRERAERNGYRQPPGLIQAALEPDHVPLPPAMRSPISSIDAAPALSSPATSPSYITRMRSASARISSRSSLSRRIATPLAAASRRYACTVSIAPTSRPRVGWATTRTSGLSSNSRPSTSFCRLPPERLRTGVSGPGVFTSYRRMIPSARSRMRRRASRG